MENYSLHETKFHGTPDFPYIVYHGKMPDFLVSFPPHWHDEAEFIYVSEGMLKITVWSQTFYAYAGDIIILMPQVIHSLEQVNNQYVEYFNLVFNFDLLGRDSCYEKYLTPFITHKRKLDCHVKKGTLLNENLEPLFLSLIQNRRKSYSTHEYLVKSNLFMIMHLLTQYSCESNENDISLQITYEKLKPILYHIQNSYANNLSVKDAASLCGFSESHFMKLFKDLTGMSFTAYLVNYRLEIAAKQLKETSANIIDISTNCGFNNHSYFTRAFKKKYGISPLKYKTALT